MAPAMLPWLLVPLALALGFKHAYDADHLVAVSNILGRAPTVRRAGRLSLAWAAGHMVTATAVTVALYYFRDALGGVLGQLDILVAAMLVLVGLLGILLELSVIHTHRHAHRAAQAHFHGEGREHEHAHLHVLGRLWKRSFEGREHRAMLGIGIVHGVASSDELLVLFAAALSVTSLGGILAGVAVFSVGVVLGMICFAVALTWPMLRWGEARVRRAVNLSAASLSLGYGAMLLAGFQGWNLFGAMGF